MAQEQKDQETKNAVQPVAQKPVKARRSPWAFLAFVLALGAAGGSAYVFWMGQQTAADLRSDLAQLRQAQLTKSDLEQQLAFRQALERQLDELRVNHREQKQRLVEQQQNLQQIQQQLVALGKTDRSDWLLAEAEYLLRLANQRLLMGRDIKGAAKMLASADAILVELDDAGLNPVRAAIAEERAALQTAASFDVEGLYLRLRGVAKSAEQLKLFERPDFEASASSEEAVSSAPLMQRWWQSFKDAFKKLEGYIRIEQRRERFQPLLAPEQEAALRYSLQLMLEQAQLALLAGNEDLYGLSLERAVNTIRRHYLLDERADQVIGLLDALREESIAVETPDISASLRALKQYIASVHWSRETGGVRE